MRILPLQKLLSMIVMLCATVMVFAQPANDDCSTPTLLVVGADAATCIPVAGDTRGTVDATTVTGPEVCSGSWYTDDVWYSFETGDDIPEFGVTIEVRLDPTSGTELIEQGLAIYTDCEAATMPITCFSDEPGRRTIDFPAQCLAPNSTFLVRLWSAPTALENSGTFSICAYDSVEPDDTGTEPMARVIYEETFDKGFNGWTNVAETMSEDADGNLLGDDFIWSSTGCVPSAFGGSDCLVNPATVCQEVGVIGMPAGWYQSNRTGMIGNTPPPYPNILAYIISPPIDLSKESCVNVTWDEAFRGLNGGTLSDQGPFVQYSLDDGETWINPSQGINTADVTINYGGNYVVNGPFTTSARQIPLLGAEGNADVRLRFGFDGDFYTWIIDNIRVVEGTTSDIIAQTYYARAHINPMSIHMVDSYDFLIDVVNLACEEQTNVVVNVTGTDSDGDIVYNNNLNYGLIESDSLAQNVPFVQPYTPAAEVEDYTFTYSVTSDADDDLTNNSQSFTHSVVDEYVFRKEDGVANNNLSPANFVADIWTEDEPFTWEMGHIFYTPSSTDLDGDPLRFNEVSFQLANAGDLAGERLRIQLYEISDNDFDFIIPKDDDNEITRLGVSSYTVTGAETGFITITLDAFIGGVDNYEELWLKPNTHYMATVESLTEATSNQVAMAIASTDAYNYQAAYASSRDNADNDLTKIRYAHAFAVSKEMYFRLQPTADITTTSFTQLQTPLIRLSYGKISELPTATADINSNIKIAVSPNPTAADLTVTLSIEDATDMEISILDLTGKVITTKSFNNVTDLREDFNVSNLSNGVYMLHIDTKDGIQTKKFVVSK